MDANWIETVPRWMCCSCQSKANYIDVIGGICRACWHNKCGHCRDLKAGEGDQVEAGAGDKAGDVARK